MKQVSKISMTWQSPLNVLFVTPSWEEQSLCLLKALQRMVGFGQLRNIFKSVLNGSMELCRTPVDYHPF